MFGWHNLNFVSANVNLVQKVRVLYASNFKQFVRTAKSRNVLKRKMLNVNYRFIQLKSFGNRQAKSKGGPEDIKWRLKVYGF